MDRVCNKGYIISHGAKVFVGAFLAASQLTKSRPEKNCKIKADDLRSLNDKELMEHVFRIAPYDYKLNPDAPLSSLELLMMHAKKKYQLTNPESAQPPETELDFPIHYDYRTIFKNFRL